MKDFLIGAGIGFVVGAVMCKTCKPVAKAVQKGKEMVEEKIEESKDTIQEKLEKASKSKTSK